MGWQGMTARTAVVAAAALVGSVVGSAAGLGTAAAAVPAAQDTSAFCVNVPSGSSGFTDISSTIHRRTIECLAHSGITQGVTDTTFDPGGEVTRGQMASFIARAIDEVNDLETIDLPDLPASAPDKFSDDDASTHEANIDRLAAAGVVSGTTATTFAPDEVVTRGQMATFINNAQRFLSNDQAPFTSDEDYFVDDETSTHEANINGIAAAGVTAGIDATHFGPSLPVLRANMATFITRYLAVLHKAGVIEALPATDPVVPPAPTAHVVTPVGEASAVITFDDLQSGATAKVYLGADGAAFANATLKASSSVDADPSTTGFQIRLTGLQPATSYEFYATQAAAGEESPPKSTTAGADTGFTTAPPVPPTVVGASGRGGSILRLHFSEPITALAGAAAKVTVDCTVLGLPSFHAEGLSVTPFDADTLDVGLDDTIPAADGGFTTCAASVGAGMVQDGATLQNAAQSGINLTA